MNKKHLNKGGLDKDVRNPNIIINIAKELCLLPKKKQTIKITGSKGKGTVTRLINSLLLLNFKNEKIGMIVSPEEIEHTDRMKINNKQISKEEFVNIATKILNLLDTRCNILNKTEYFSPSGIFLLIALQWFKNNNVQHYILELGRGAEFDEAGQIESNISVVTSILEEHMSYLGPTLKDIAQNKLFVNKTSDLIILGPLSSSINEKYGIINNNYPIININDNIDKNDKPFWYLIDEKIADKTVEEYCNSYNIKFLKQNNLIVSESFGIYDFNNANIIYEPLVSINSIDKEFISNLISTNKKLNIIASLPDDKDLQNIVNYFSSINIPVNHIILTGTRGYLYYHNTNKYYNDKILETIDYQDVETIKELIVRMTQEKNGIVYFLGTHTYIRLIKLAMKELGIINE
jgi:dihydrofolate synthase/folylpolyglutamate synthase